MRTKHIAAQVFFILFFLPAISLGWWTSMESGTTSNLYGVWGSSGSDVFAVGYGSPMATIVHYDGDTWSSMLSYTESTLNSVWGSSGSDVFAVGDDGTILHYDGSDWNPVTSDTIKRLRGVWGSSGSNVFAVGDDGTILHYDGSEWSAMSSGTTNDLYDVWGSFGSSVFAVGNDGTILHYDGSEWNVMSSGTSYDIRGVWGSSGSGVFAVCYDILESRDMILQYNGEIWSVLPSGIDLRGLEGLWGMSETAMYFVGRYSNIYYYDGHGIVSIDENLGLTINDDFYGIWGDSGSDMFVVGDSGIILHYDGLPEPETTTTTSAAVTTSTTTTVADGGSDQSTSTTSSPTTTTSIAAGPFDKAIIVAGSGEYPGNNLWDATQVVANYAYGTLAFQGFDRDDIYYLTFDSEIDVDLDGTVDGDAEPTVDNLRYAVTVWAKDADDLIIYLTGHGGDRKFLMDGEEEEYLYASSLNEWLNQLQDDIDGMVILIYDSCQSGSFLRELVPDMSGKERICITSTEANEFAHFVNTGLISFSNYFWLAVLRAEKLYDSFVQGKDAMEFSFRNKQSPQIDCNGNGTGNESADRCIAAREYTIGTGDNSVGADVPTIDYISEAQTLYGSPTATITVDGVNSTAEIIRVWAVVYGPETADDPPSVPRTNLPEIELLRTATSAYTGSYSGFTTAGEYRISVYAKALTGTEEIISIPRVTKVVQLGTEGECTDTDGDLFFQEGGDCGEVDCDDTDPEINPDADEVCDDEIDNDCDGYTDCNDYDCLDSSVCADTGCELIGISTEYLRTGLGLFPRFARITIVGNEAADFNDQSVLDFGASNIRVLSQKAFDKKTIQALVMLWRVAKGTHDVHIDGCGGVSITVM